MTTEVQSHGFVWERELCEKVYGATMDEMKGIKYTSKMDLPGKFNRLDNCDLSIKTSCSPNTVCMADCLRVFDAARAGSNSPSEVRAPRALRGAIPQPPTVTR